jgi:hypothetical protein
MTHPTVARPPARRALAAAGVLAGLALVAAGAWLLANVAASDTTVVRTTYGNVRVLRIGAASGAIELVSARPGAPLTVEEHVTRGLIAPWRHNRLTGGELSMRSECRVLLAPSCSVRYVVHVPRQTAVFATSGSDDVKADGVATDARVELVTGSGEVRVRGLSAPGLKLQSGSGGIGATGLSVPALWAQTGSGDIALGVRDPAGSLFAQTGSGDVVLMLPDRPYALSAATGDGHIVDTGVRQDTTSPHKVTARAGSGDIVLDVVRR